MLPRRAVPALMALPLLAACSGPGLPGQAPTTTVVVQSPASAAGATTGAGTPVASATQAGTTSPAPATPGTTAGDAAPTDRRTSAAPAATSTPRAEDASLADLRRALVPADCRMPAVRLVDGKTPTDLRPRQGLLADSPRPILADVDGDGAKEVLGSYWCSAGGVSWPGRVLVVKPGGRTLTTYSLARDAEHSTLRELYQDGTGVHLTFDTTEGATGDPTRYTGVLRVDGTTARLDGERRTPIRTSEVGSASFVSPGGTLLCHLEADAARCDVVDARFDAPPKPAGCEGDWGRSLAATRDEAGAFACVTDSVYGGETTAPSWWRKGVDPLRPLGGGQAYGLAYGHVLHSGMTSCEVLPSAGVWCQTGDHGFELSKDTYRTW